MTIKIGKKTDITLAILGILAAIYNVIFFAVPWHREVSEISFWITYGCTWLALIFAGITVAVAFDKKNLKSRIFGIPVHRVGYTVVLLQLVLDFVVMGVSCFYEIWWWIPAVVEILIFGFGIIAVIVRQTYRNFIDKVDDKRAKKAYIEQLKAELDSLVESNTIETIKSDLEKLHETVKYTDPVSYKEAEDIEDQITVAFEELEKTITDDDVDKSKTLIAKISRLLKERKTILKNVR